MGKTTDVALQVVFKVASRCNLNCSYCYVYNKGDDSWRGRPALMSESVFRAAVERTRRHCLHSRQRSVCLTFHGGEPCLVGATQFDAWCSYAREALQDTVRVRLCLQTNGTLLDQAWVEVLAKQNVHVGISMDGVKSVHDHFRVDHQGRGSYDDVVRGLVLLQEAKVPSQILSVVQFGADGLQVHRHFVSLGARMIHYLLPDFNHDTIQAVRNVYGATPCADYLIPIFDEWYSGGMDVKVSLFWNIARLILGGESNVDILGNQPLRFVFVESDGQIEVLDVLRASVSGITGTGLNVMADDFRQMAGVSSFHSDVVFNGVPIPTDCRSCIEKDTCAGGYLPHRYSRNRAFDNPSVWCADLLRLFNHVRGRLGVTAEDTRLRRDALAELAEQCTFDKAALLHTTSD